MDKEFVPYELAVKLKELGFDEPCLAHLIGFGDGTKENGKYVINYQQVFYPNNYISSDDKAEELGLHPFGICGVPLYQQVFRFFREKYGLYSWVTMELGNKSTFCWVLSGEHTSTQYAVKMGTFKRIPIKLNAYFHTYEEAELACLDKLIEICKTKTND